MNSTEKESGVGIESCRSQGERDRAGGRFMEGTYPEIYMNLWQEMRQMQRGGKRVVGGRMARRELPGYNFSGSETLPGKVWC